MGSVAAKLFSQSLEEVVEIENVMELIQEENEPTTVSFSDRRGQKEEKESKENGQRKVWVSRLVGCLRGWRRWKER